MGNEWNPPPAPPPPLFLGKKERDLVKQVNDELIERVVGQAIVYYPIDVSSTNYHNLYGEAIEKNFLPPIRVHALVSYGDIYYEIMSLSEPRQLFGQIDHKLEIVASCARAREGLFDAR